MVTFRLLSFLFGFLVKKTVILTTCPNRIKFSSNYIDANFHFCLGVNFYRAKKVVLSNPKIF